MLSVLHYALVHVRTYIHCCIGSLYAPWDTLVEIVLPILNTWMDEAPAAKKHLFCLILALHSPDPDVQSQHNESYSRRSSGALWDVGDAP